MIYTGDNMKIGGTITLKSDNLKYMIVSKAEYKGKDYYLLIEITNSDNAVFCYEEDNKIYIVDKNDLDFELLKKLYDVIKEEYNKIN